MPHRTPYADLEQWVAVDPATTRFPFGSVAKPMTATAVAQLHEEGRLDLDAPIHDYLPDYPRTGKGITTRQLAGHLAGIRHYRGAEFLNARPYQTVSDGPAIFMNDPLLFEPGTRFSHSSYGYNLLSAVVEAVAERDFLEYMAERVFRPLGMTQTVADHITPITANRSRPYDWVDGAVTNAPFVDNSYKWAGGGFLSTSDDLVRFGFGHLDGGILRADTVDMLWRSQQTADGDETNYGIGWRTATDSRDLRYAGHGGGSVGGRTMFLVYPEQQLVLAVIGLWQRAGDYRSSLHGPSRTKRRAGRG